MTSTTTDLRPIRIASIGHVLFAAAMIWLGIVGLRSDTFAQIWAPVPKWFTVREPLAYLCALISLTAGVGLLFRRMATIASRVLFATLLLWLLVFRVPNLFYEKPLVLVGWTFGSTAVMAAAALVLYVWFATDRDRQRFGLIADARGVRIARALYGLSLVPFGLAHWMYPDATTVLIPPWLPWHTALAFLTGVTFIAAGLAMAVGVVPRLAAALSTLQVGLFSLIVWVPRVLAGPLNEFQWGEFVATCVLTAGAWVVTDSYRGTPWLAPDRTMGAERATLPAVRAHSV
ncbi:MAG: DoxX family protein [Gemmatimonadaceae bacterium]